MTAPPPTRHLTQRPAAAALAATLLAIPGIPLLADAVLPERTWEPAAAVGPTVDILSADGHGVTVGVPDGWESQDQGDGAVLRTAGATVIVSVYDRNAREPRALADRVMRSNRLAGIHAAWDGGRVGSTDGSLTGDTCVAVTTDAAGGCAFVVDDDVVVSVISLADADHPAVPVTDVVAPLRRSAE
ncbi:hypothetical protein [Mycolicibacterium grossiae]|uniref:Uncharacterized protein n=1 Tax=Mycolicibacterium grossiae TaxID=1552759 RepID=A0A1E8Q133_9MYCO|nr:hypothetical protein [Mycolicibacterium grossiae]OFJ52071.1 hypothetical protein BEL07_19275 [Mycolicibacterium grossiae]QEM47399.1 hypothetical protein FZ046_23850 [Mycolicibacterium grossiae]